VRDGDDKTEDNDSTTDGAELQVLTVIKVLSKGETGVAMFAHARVEHTALHARAEGAQ